MASKKNNKHIEPEGKQSPPLAASTSEKTTSVKASSVKASSVQTQLSEASVDTPPEAVSAKQNIDQEMKNNKDTQTSKVSGTTTDTSTSKESTATTADKVKSKPEADNKKSNKVGLLAIALLVLIGGSGHIYYQQQQNGQLQEQLSALQSQLAQSQSSFSNMGKEIENKATKILTDAEVTLSQQQHSIEQLQAALSDVKGRRPNDWLLAETDYLVKLAGRKLFLEHDIVTATALMEEADQRIAVLNDPSLVPLRKAMAQDIAQLKMLPLIDRDGLVLRLNSLQQQVEHLPLANAILPEEQTVVVPKVSDDLYDWKDNLAASFKSFSAQFITFRVRDGNVVPLLSPQQHFYLRENINGKLETAIAAVYREQSDVYKTSLDMADKWSSSFFDQDSIMLKEFHKTLQQLKEQNIKVDYPAKLQTQPILSTVIRERLRRDVKSMTTTDTQNKAVAEVTK